MAKKNKQTPLAHSDLLLLIDSAHPQFEPKWNNAARNEEILLANNFTDTQRQQIRAQGRQPISISQAATKITRISGIQRSQRTEFNILAAADPNDEIKAQLAKLQTHAVERRSNFANLESEIFTSAIGVIYGVSKMDLDHTDVYPRVKVGKIPYNNFMWDSNAKSFDLSDDALWVCEVEKLYREQLEEEFPNAQISDASASEGTFQGRDKNAYYISKNNDGKNAYDIISKFTMEIKSPRTIYYVIFPDSQGLNGLASVIEGKYKSREEAEERLRELQIPYLLQGLPIEGQIESRDVVGYDRYIFTYNSLLKYEQTDLEMFSYNVCFGVKFEEKFVAFMDYLRDPQLFYDRFIMQIDYAMGKDNKAAFELNVNALAEGETPETAVAKVEQGKIILKRGVDKVLQVAESKGASPQWLGMIDLLTVILEDLSGGGQFNAKSGTGDSGIKVQQLVQQGSLQVKPFLDNLRRWKVAVGRNILWWLRHYETAEDVIRVQGGALSPEMLQLLEKNGIYAPSQFSKGDGYITLNQEGNELSYLADSKFELEVTEEAMSDNEKRAHLLTAMEVEKTDPIFAQSVEFKKYKIGLMDNLPPDIRYKMVQEMEAIQQQNQEMAKQKAQAENEKMQNDYDIEKQKLNIERAKVLVSDKNVIR